MASLELNKIMGAILAPLLLASGLNVLSGLVFTPRPAGDAGYALPVPDAGATANAGAQAPQEQPLPVLLASADPARGQTAAKKCASCHAFEEAGGNKVGPNLHGVAGRPKASHAGFGYSGAMKEKGGAWTYEDLYQFLLNPKGFVPGTSMAFAGIKAGQERADILAYLKSISPEAPPLPTP